MGTSNNGRLPNKAAAVANWKRRFERRLLTDRRAISAIPPPIAGEMNIVKNLKKPGMMDISKLPKKDRIPVTKKMTR